jgi:hypothetical protein
VHLLRRVPGDLAVTGALALTAERRDCAPPVPSRPVMHSPGYPTTYHLGYPAGPVSCPTSMKDRP